MDSFHESTCNLEMIIFLNLFQGVGHDDEKVLVLAATNTPYALDQVRKVSSFRPCGLWLYDIDCSVVESFEANAN
jgi:hypothetical protein